MGVEQVYQALPPGCGLVEMARADAESGDTLADVPGWFSGEVFPGAGRPVPGGYTDPVVAPYWSLCCRLAGEYPELVRLNCDLDRRFDILEYLLCAGRRGDEPTEADRVLGRVFEIDADIVAEHVRATQGRWVRHVPAGVVAEAAALLTQVTPSDLRQHFDAPRMVAAGVYKFHADRTSPEWWADTEKHFGLLRGFMVATADAGFDAIFVID